MSQMQSRVASNTAPVVGQLGTDAVLSVPGLITPPAVSEVTATVDALERALSGGSLIARQLTQLELDELRARQQAAREQAELDRQAEAKFQNEFRGLGQQAARDALPRLRSEIEAGGWTPAKGTTPEAFVDSILQQEADSGIVDQSDVARETFRNALRAPLLEAVYGRWQKAKDADAALAVRNLANAAAAVDTPEAVGDVLAEARKTLPGRSDEELREAILVPALRAAANAGDTARFAAVEANLEPAKFSIELRSAASRLDEVKRAEQANKEREAERGFFAAVEAGASYDTLTRRLDADVTLPAEKRLQLRSTLTQREQGRTVLDIRRRVLDGTMTAPEVRERVTAASKLAPDDPGFINPDLGYELINEAARAERVDVARSEVVGVLSGGRGVLTESQHGTAVAGVLGPSGLGFINAENRITQPAPLAATVLTLGVLPRETADVLVANLGRGNDAEVYAAASAVGMIGASDPNLYARLLDVAGDQADLMVTEAVEAFRAGRVRPPEAGATVPPASMGLAVQRIREAQTLVQPVPKTAPEIAEEFKAAKIDLSVETSRALARAAAGKPHTRDTLLGLDWLNPDPSIGIADNNVRRRVEGYYADRYTRLRSKLPADRASEEASKYASARVSAEVDFVRWGNDVEPVLIDNGQGLRLPEDLRWADGFEEEAAKELEGLGFQRDDVVTMRPFLVPSVAAGVDPTEMMGWQYVTRDGDPLVDDAGNLILFRPSDATKKRAAEIAAVVAAKSRGLSRPAMRASANLATLANQLRANQTGPREVVPIAIPRP